MKEHVPLANNAIIRINSARAYALDVVLSPTLNEKHVEEIHHHLLAALRVVRKLKQQIKNKIK